MKKSILPKLLMLLLSPLPAWADGCGGSCGGGGLRMSSTEAEVQDVVNHLGQIVSPLLADAIKYQLLNPDTVTDPDLKHLLAKMAGPKTDGQRDAIQGYFLNDELKHLKITLKDSCPSRNFPNGNGDAETDFKRDAPICMSKTRLMQLRPDELRLQLASLLFNEWGHHFQSVPKNRKELDDHEKETRALQGYILGNFKSGFASLDPTTDLKSGASLQPPRDPIVLFTGGRVSMNVSLDAPRPTQFVCARQANSVYNLPDKLRSLDDGAVILAPGSATSVNWRVPGVSFPQTIECRDWPAVQCSIQTRSLDGGKEFSLLLGDQPDSFSSGAPTSLVGEAEKDVKKRLKDFQGRGVCQPDAATANAPAPAGPLRVTCDIDALGAHSLKSFDFSPDADHFVRKDSTRDIVRVGGIAYSLSVGSVVDGGIDMTLHSDAPSKNGVWAHHEASGSEVQDVQLSEPNGPRIHCRESNSAAPADASIPKDFPAGAKTFKYHCDGDVGDDDIGQDISFHVDSSGKLLDDPKREFFSKKGLSISLEFSPQPQSYPRIGLLVSTSSPDGSTAKREMTGVGKLLEYVDGPLDIGRATCNFQSVRPYTPDSVSSPSPGDSDGNALKAE